MILSLLQLLHKLALCNRPPHFMMALLATDKKFFSTELILATPCSSHLSLSTKI